jgi:hypothetical protein
VQDASKTEPSTLVIVITGMHRSGTSLVASAFQLGGLHIGDRLYGVGPGNRRGHFEDLDFQEFHEGVLERVGKSHVTATPADVREMTPEEVGRAATLIDQRRERRPWGWKDPRTCLFLDFWNARLTDPCYVFVYRHPLEVVLSMFRRGIDPELAEVVTDPLVGLEAWRVYNQAILDFYHRHRDRCVLGHVGALASDLDGAVSLCAEKFGIDLASDGVSALYHPAELVRHVVPDEILAEFSELAPSVAALYSRLERAADLPDPAPARSSCPDAGARVDTAGQRLDLLLNRLAPRAVLAGKWALDAFRRRELAGLRSELAAVEQERRRSEIRLDDVEQRLREAAGQAAAAEASIVRLESDLRTRAAHNAALARTIAEKERLLAAIGQTLSWRAAQQWYAFKRAGLRLLGRAR